MQFDKSTNFDEENRLSDDLFGRRADSHLSSFPPPPPELKASVMRAIDFGGKNSPTAGTIFRAYFRRVGIPSAACLLLLMASFFRYSPDKSAAPLNYNHADAVFTALSTSFAGINYSKIPISSSIADADYGNLKTSGSHFLNSKISSNTSGNTFFRDILQLPSSFDFAESVAAPKIDFSANDNFSSNSANNLISDNYTMHAVPVSASSNLIPQSDLPLIKDRIHAKSATPLTLSLRGISSENLNLQNSSAVQTNSFALGIYTPLSQNSDFKIGLEVGREPFDKKYFDRGNPNEIIAEKSVNTFWGALAINYSYSGKSGRGIAGGLKPTVSLMLGAGEIGPTVRSSIGLEQSISRNVSAYVGIEGSAMFYNNRYNWFSSRNFGITAGVNYIIK